MTENVYPMMLNILLKEIERVKLLDRTIPIIDIILEYCTRQDIDLDMIGDAISTDVYLKNLLEMDLRVHNYTNEKVSDDW